MFEREIVNKQVELQRISVKHETSRMNVMSNQTFWIYSTSKQLL